MFSHLNPEQRKAVEATKGRVLILAGAGSGKTSVLSYRMAHLIQNMGVSPTHILGLTFTNKAAQEMKERVGNIVSAKVARQTTLCTFHSFCMQVLRKEIHHLGYTKQFSLYDERDVRRLLQQIIKDSLEHEGELPSLLPTMQKIATLKTNPAEEEEGESKTWHDVFSRELVGKLETCMRAYNAVDFDSLLSLTVKLFTEHPSILAHYQDRYHYIMIDEYQDTSPIQYELANLLSGKSNNLCVVGDDDQSIYGWRGAEVKNILHFPCQTKIKLEQNYRSTSTILRAANGVISHNKERHRKELWSSIQGGEPITLFHAPTEVEEAQSIIQRLIWMRKHKNLRWKDMAILYRSNILSRHFETALINAVWEEEGKWKRGIPYAVYGGTEFYERAEIKDILAYLKVIANPLDTEALLRIINVPRRGISEQTLDMLTTYNRTHQLSLWDVLEKASLKALDLPKPLSEKALKGIQSFLTLMKQAKQKFTQGPLSSTFASLLEEVRYKDAIKEEVKSEKMRQFKWDNVLQCIESLKEYESQGLQENREISLQDFVGTTSLDNQKNSFREKENKEDKVHLMTIHSAKGLEFAACFLVGVEDHIIPHEKSVSDTGLEEERRLMYVALTRAKNYLTISMARQRKKMGKEISTSPSRFLFEIPKELIKVTSHQTLC